MSVPGLFLAIILDVLAGYGSDAAETLDIAI